LYELYRLAISEIEKLIFPQLWKNGKKINRYGLTNSCLTAKIVS
jgi:hypothetical protein